VTFVRGRCPGISDPMATGDGLLARLACDAPITLPDFVALCEASRTLGNGIVEVTQRGNLQFRGLTITSAPDFAETVTSLGLGTHPATVSSSPLLGLDALEELDVRELVEQVRGLRSSGPKVSVLIDGGGKLHLDQLPADIRLRAAANGQLQLSWGTTHMGWIALENAVAVVERLLAMLERGSRARDLPAPQLDGLVAATAPESRPPAEPVGTHELKRTGVALGLALPFGHSSALALQRLAAAAAVRGAASIRPAPGRALLLIGLSHSAAQQLAAVAAEEDFIVRPNDPRRHVVACAGSPACAAAMLPTRELAPAIARAAGGLLDGSVTVHLSGCAKGCAHPGRAALTIAGPDRVILDGTASDPAHSTCPPAKLVARVVELLRG
jgi:precorrin-3B synthase